LEQVTREEKIVLDDQSRILDEYMKNLSLSGQPGVGDAFFKWVWQNQANMIVCERVEIHRRGRGAEDYEEFPSSPSLCGFDPSDKKFVAVALGSKSNPQVLTAVERGWWNHRTALEQCGVRVKFLCPSKHNSRGNRNTRKLG